MTLQSINDTAAARTQSDPRWAAIVARDPHADGRFYYSVRTTGVYCRPSCAARRAKPENVAFHASTQDAERAGFRPCKRCRPDRLSPSQAQATLVATLCRFIESADHVPTLAELATRAGLSAHHLHRTFRAITGVTPRAYAAAHRARRMRDALTTQATVTDAIYDAGYGSNGRFYDESNGVLGMTPTRYRAGGAGTRIRFAVGECSLGSVLVASSEKGVCAVLLGDDPDELARDLQDRFPRANLIGGDRDFERVVSQVVGFVERPAKIGTCRWTCGAQHFSKECGKRCEIFPPARLRRIRKLPDGSEAGKRCERWPGLAQLMLWPLRYRATGSYGLTGAFRAIAGEWSARERCWKEKALLSHYRMSFTRRFRNRTVLRSL